MLNNIDHIIKPEQAITLHGLFLERVKRTPDAVAYRFFDTHQEVWLALTWEQMHAQVTRWQAALLRENLVAGDRVAIMLRNCPQWVMFEQAAMSIGLEVVPLYTVDRPDNVAYILNDAQVKVLLFETGEQWQALRTVIGQLGCVQRFVSLDKVAGNDDGGCDTLLHSSRLREPQPAAPPAPADPVAPCRDGRLQCTDAWLPAQAAMQPERGRKRDDLVTIMYTSGTTGKPKGMIRQTSADRRI